MFLNFIYIYIFFKKTKQKWNYRIDNYLYNKFGNRSIYFNISNYKAVIKILNVNFVSGTETEPKKSVLKGILRTRTDIGTFLSYFIEPERKLEHFKMLN